MTAASAMTVQQRYEGRLPWQRVGGHRHPVPERATRWSGGYDLAWSGLVGEEERVEASIYPFEEPIRLATGWAVQLPTGWVGLISERSSLWSRGLLVRGVIDADYRGEIFLQCAFTGEEPALRIKPGVPIAQMVIVPNLLLPSIEVAHLDETERGSGGFGHTDALRGEGR